MALATSTARLGAPADVRVVSSGRAAGVQQRMAGDALRPRFLRGGLCALVQARSCRCTALPRSSLPILAQSGSVAAPPLLDELTATSPAERLANGAGEPGSSSNGSASGKLPPNFGDLSYSQQYNHLFQSMPLDVKRPVPKPCPVAQQAEPDSKPVLLSSVAATQKRNRFLSRTWEKTDFIYVGFMVVMHGLCLLAPVTFSWPMVGLFFASYFVTGCLGITLSYHRQLSHRSFQTPKWLEYVFAYCGVLAVQGDPIEWVSSHRYHHLHTDTPLDPHSPYEGFWWSHMGWLLDNKATLERVGARGNTSDMDVQPFYTFITKTYAWHVVASFAALYAFGGLPALVWGGALRAVWVYHVTWFVNSASHVWGTQAFNTGDQSRNNWWVGILAFGEGWHNNHHAFEYSAKHGLQKGQFDMTWMVIWALEKLGLATNVKLPSQKAQARLAFPEAA